MSKATPAQIACLKNYGIKAPTDKKMCSRFISFLKNNNCAGPASEGERVAMLKSMMTKFNGKKATRSDNSQTVIIKQVYPKTEREVLDDRRDNKENYDTTKVSPFLVSYSFEFDGKTRGSHTSPNNLIILTE